MRRCDDATMRRVRYVGLRVGCAWLDLLHALKTQMCPALRNLISTDLPIFLDRAHKVPATRANPFQQLVGGIPRIEQHPDLHTTGHRAPGTGHRAPGKCGRTSSSISITRSGLLTKVNFWLASRSRFNVQLAYLFGLFGFKVEPLRQRECKRSDGQDQCHAARCTLHVARCTLHVARCTLHVALV